MFTFENPNRINFQADTGITKINIRDSESTQDLHPIHHEE